MPETTLAQSLESLLAVAGNLREVKVQNEMQMRVLDEIKASVKEQITKVEKSKDDADRKISEAQNLLELKMENRHKENTDANVEIRKAVSEIRDRLQVIELSDFGGKINDVKKSNLDLQEQIKVMDKTLTKGLTILGMLWFLVQAVSWILPYVIQFYQQQGK